MNANRNIVDHLLKYRSRLPLSHHDFPLILFWSHKSGCTTLTKWFFYQMDLLEEAQKESPSVHQYRSLYYGKLPTYTARLKDILLDGEKEGVKLVRSPYRRAVSSYLHFCREGFFGNKKTSLYKEWEAVERLFHSKTQPFQGISFKQFLYYLQLRGASMDAIEPHIAQQYIEGEEEIINRYIKLEHFEEGIRNLEESFELKETDLSTLSESPHHFSAHMEKNERTADIIVTKDRLRSKSIPTYESFFDLETTELIKDIYHEDIRHYHYPEHPIFTQNKKKA